MVDAGILPVPDAGPIDADLPVDAAPPDAVMPGACFEPLTSMRPDRTTVSLGGFGGMALPVNEPFDLPISVDNGCFCREQFLCDVSVRRGPGLDPAIIELNSAICTTADVCDECLPHIDGVCRIPALPPGNYRVRMNGEEAFLLTLPVLRSDTEEQLSFTPAPPVPEGLICPWESTSIDLPSEMCAPAQVLADTSAQITLTKSCGSCFDEPADCEVHQQGSRLIVTARTRSCDCPACGACADVCVPVQTSCRLPPLRPGSYTLVTDLITTDILTIEVVPSFPGGVPPAVPPRCVAIDISRGT